MYGTTPQVTVKNEYHTKVGNGGYAAIGPQSALHVGQSAMSTGLVYDLILSHCDVNLNLFASHGFALENSEMWKRLWEEHCVSLT